MLMERPTGEGINMSIWSDTMEAFCEQVASSAPVPSCGAAACASASFSLALLLMALRKSVGGEQDRRLTSLTAETQALLAVIKAHADNDMKTFAAFIENSTASASGHDPQLSLDVTLGSLAAARSCLQGIELAAAAMPCVKKSLKCDVTSCALMLHGSLSALLINVEADAGNLSCPEQARSVMGDRARIQSAADSLLAVLRVTP
jgi:formiminotetrahydrofolate cyclodeaminase